MGELVVFIIKWVVRVAFVMAGVFAFIVVVNLATSLIFVALNQNVLSDLFALIQMWLPFNLSVLLAWLTTASIAFITYKLAVMSLSWLNRILGQS